MKKNLLICFALLCSIWAWADNAFSIEDFTIAAGEEKFIEVKMYSDVTMCAFQFDLELPEGISVTKVNATNRLKRWDPDEGDEGAWVPVHTVTYSLQSSGCYKVMAYATPSTDIGGTSGDAVVKVKIKASDQVSTGTFSPTISKQEMTEADGTKHKIDDATYSCGVTINTTVTTLGYASFSWPKALDFTNSGLTAFIATTCDGSTLHLESVTKVPANTGLILKGTAGSENTYSLETTEEATDDVSGNLLSSNTADVYTVASDDIYVLSNLDDGRPGFYKAGNGIHVAKYKSYLQYSASGSRLAFTFDEGTTGIVNSVKATDKNRQYYNLQGQRVNKAQKGIYIVDNKMYVIK